MTSRSPANYFPRNFLHPPKPDLKIYDSFLSLLTHLVPPDILDYPTSTDMVVREGSNVTLKCAATGSPAPNIVWRREGGEKIMLFSGNDGKIEV